jgi:hypothetical protein
MGNSRAESAIGALIRSDRDRHVANRGVLHRVPHRFLHHTKGRERDVVRHVDRNARIVDNDRTWEDPQDVFDYALRLMATVTAVSFGLRGAVLHENAIQRLPASWLW